MNNSHQNSGFSLVDTIIGMTIIAVAIVGIQIAQTNYVRASDRTEFGVRAVTLANSVMNIIRMHNFDENANSPWSTSLGEDTGESSLADYDDIDDYADGSWDFSGDGFDGFSVQSRIFYVAVPTNWLDSTGTATNFKRIIVSVNHSVLEAPVIVSSIVAGVE